MSDLSSIPVTVVGASRGLGRVLVEAFYRQGAQVLAVARGKTDLDILARDLPGVAVLACDASAADAPDKVFAIQVPRLLILCGGDIPRCLPFPELDWETFSASWNNETRMSFYFLKAALQRPLPSGTTVVTITSGAMLQGSPISGGYAGAKRMQAFLNSYAQKEAGRAGLELCFMSLAPARLMPQSDVGKAGVSGYAAYNGLSEAAFLESMGPKLTLEAVAKALTGLLEAPSPGGNFIVSPDGVSALS